MEGKSSTDDPFYGDAKKYWEGIPPTVDGMLGGFSHISSTDIAGSTKFLREFVSGPEATTQCNRALDCGAGIGRITKRLLIPLFKNVDMVELNANFLKQAPTYLGPESEKVERYICSGLQDFTPEPGRYDVIWSQWVLGHLKEAHLIRFFQRCKEGLAPGGIIVVKENIAPNREMEFDQKDSSYCRPRTTLVNLMLKAGLTIIKEEKQSHFPKNIYDVRIFALK